MKCIRCDHDSKKSERTDRRCPKCRGVFAFDPNEGDPCSDVQFQRALQVVSGEGTIRFHRRHVRWQLEKHIKEAPSLFVVLTVVFTMVVAMLLLTLVVGTGSYGGLPCPILLVLGMVVALVIRSRRRVRLAQLDNRTFDTMWARWTAVHEPPKGQIEVPKEPRRTRSLDAELEQYSFDRAVICDEPALVEVLLKNRFHFENNCAVLSVDGHPAAAFPVVRKMLKNNPKLLVLAVHDASPEGCRLAHRLRTDPEWFPDHARIVDVGLRPAHAPYFQRQIATASSGTTVRAGGGITVAEAAWLSKYQIDAMAIRPEQLIKRLYRAMTSAEDGGGTDIVYMGTDSGTVDGGADSFG